MHHLHFFAQIKQGHSKIENKLFKSNWKFISSKKIRNYECNKHTNPKHWI